MPRVAPGLAPAPPAAPAAQPSAATHAIRDVAVTGMTAYPVEEIAPLTDGLAGASVPQSAIEAARSAIVRRYRQDGFVYTVVNATIADGHLRFAVTEGRVAEVKLDGDIGPAATQVLRFLNHLTEVRPIDIATLERWLLLASDVPGVSVQSTLNPSSGEPGALTLIATVSRRAVSGLAVIDNRGFPQAGPEEALGVVDFNSFSEFGEKTELSLYQAFNNGSQTFGQGSVEAFIGGSGLKLRVYGGAGPTNPSGNLQAIGYQGQTLVFGGALSYPVIRARQQTLNVAAAFDALQSDISTTATGVRVRNSYDSLRVLRFGAEYAFLDLLLGPAMTGTTGATVRVSQGLTGLGATANGYALAPRTGENVGFTKVTGEINRTQTLFQPWDGASVALQGILAGQYSGDILPPAEKFYLGGLRLNRGYYYGQVSGDSALSASVELQLNTALPLPVSLPADVSAQFYAFYDWGETWENLPVDPNRQLTSVGGGVRTFVTRNVEVDLEGTVRLNRYPNGSGPGVSALNGGAFYWRVLTRF
jgi:hemolysin activation/secretion protein